MKLISFHLMPYRPLDFEDGGEAPLGLGRAAEQPLRSGERRRGIRPPISTSWSIAEQLGFDGIGVNEHHQTAYGMMPAPNLIASALIQRTKTVKIAILGRALPLQNNPIFVAEEYAMLDNLSKGRIIAGFVRGIGAEYHSTGVNPYFSHERFHEAHDLIVSAWTRARSVRRSKASTTTIRYVNLVAAALSDSRIRRSGFRRQGSSETVAWAARSGAQISVPGHVLERPSW